MTLADVLGLAQPDVPKKSSTFDPNTDRILTDPALHGFNEGDLVTNVGPSWAMLPVHAERVEVGRSVHS